MQIFKIFVVEAKTKTKIKTRDENNKNQQYISRDENI